MQSGAGKWEAAGFLGMSVEMIDRVYGHHYPEHLRKAANALGYRSKQSLAVAKQPSLPLPQTAERKLPVMVEPRCILTGPGFSRALLP